MAIEADDERLDTITKSTHEHEVDHERDYDHDHDYDYDYEVVTLREESGR